jgi:hypothetical protein
MTDDRVPGSRIPELMMYSCPACGRTVWDEKRPECPFDGTLMEPTDQLPFQDRRAAIRRAREKEEEAKE